MALRPTNGRNLAPNLLISLSPFRNQYYAPLSGLSSQPFEGACVFPEKNEASTTEALAIKTLRVQFSSENSQLALTSPSKGCLSSLFATITLLYFRSQVYQ
jgi:hypothetical protein